MDLKDYPLDALMEITARPDIVFVKGEGSWLWDHDGPQVPRLRAGLGGQLPGAFAARPGSRR